MHGITKRRMHGEKNAGARQDRSARSVEQGARRIVFSMETNSRRGDKGFGRNVAFSSQVRKECVYFGGILRRDPIPWIVKGTRPDRTYL